MSKLLTLVASVLLAVSLTACGPSGASQFDTQKRLATVPGDIKACIYKLIPRPYLIQTKAQIAAAITKLKASADAKTDCGIRLINLYESQEDLH